MSFLNGFATGTKLPLSCPAAQLALQSRLHTKAHTMNKGSPKGKKPRIRKAAQGRAKGERVRVLISRDRIHRRIKELAKEIRRDFPQQPLHLVGVLKGAVFFLADLARQIPGEVSFDFIALSSYGKNTHSSGQVRLTRDLDSSIENKTVIVVEDILDTGMTLQYLLRVFQQRKPKALRVAVLLDKPSRRVAPVRADYVGFEIPNEFVVGYGLDYAERYRNLLDVGILTLPETPSEQLIGVPQEPPPAA
jgi:hypoxanthine phosphoribosyltransferase